MATRKEVAAELDLSERRIGYLQAEGVLPRAAYGQLDLDACRVAYIRHMRAKASDPQFLSLTDAKARLAKEQADGHELRNAETRAGLLDADEVATAWAEMRAGILSRLSTVPDRVAAALPRLTAAEIDMIRAEVAAALVPLAEDAGQDASRGSI